MCRLAHKALRSAVFIVGGVLVSLLVAWVVSLAPWLGVLLGLCSLALFARALLMAFFRPSPLVALTHMAASIALGVVIAGLVGLLVA